MAYSAANQPTNADAIPLYNDNFFKVWNWFDTVWNCNDWMTWHKALKAKYGKETAQNTFLKYWNDLATGSNAIDCRSFDSAFRSYMEKENLLDSLYGGIGIIAKPLGTANDIITSGGSSISNIGKAMEGVTKVISIAIPVLLVAAIGFGGFWAYKKYVKK